MLAYEQRVSVANRITVSRPFSVAFRGWLESPSPNIAWPAVTALITRAPPPGTLKPGRLRPSSSKTFFSRATRCWPYTNVETLCETVIGLPFAPARAGNPWSASAPVRPAARRKRRRVHVVERTSMGTDHNILTVQRISSILSYSMVRSMTGFGRAELRGDTVVVSVEARSVNHRHLDVAIRLPRALAALELDARRTIAARLERGRVD